MATLLRFPIISSIHKNRSEKIVPTENPVQPMADVIPPADHKTRAVCGSG